MTRSNRRETMLLLGIFCQLIVVRIQAQEIPSPLSTPELARLYNPSIVTIRQLDRRGNEAGIGSGFFISEDGLIATNLHVIGEGRQVRITDNAGSEFPLIQIFAWNRSHDLAIIRVDTGESKVSPIPLAPENAGIEQGQQVIALGNPQGLERSVVEGIISGVRTFDRTQMYQLAIPIEPGNSGGPLMDRLGKAHGILTLKSLVTENLGFAVSISHLHQLLTEPNTISQENWIRLGELNPSIWETRFGADWKRRQGSIHVSGLGQGFGGRSLLLNKRPVLEAPYEVSVRVRLDDESGAAGILFGASESHDHWGFYPSNGSMRLTHFQGPDVYSWEIVQQTETRDYRPGEWNELRVIVTSHTIEGYVNGIRILQVPQAVPPLGLAGLAKFRQTSATFSGFQILRSETFPSPEISEYIHTSASSGDLSALESELLASNLESMESPAISNLLLREADALRRRSQQLENLATNLHGHIVIQEILQCLESSPEPDLLQAALLFGKFDDPQLDVSAYEEMIDAIATEILISLPDFATQTQRMDALRHHLFENYGFRGSRNDYRNKANSILSQVIDDREGLPITLSLLALEVGQRIFIDGLSGAALPGHFMVAWEQKGQPTKWLDAFTAGHLLNADQVAEMVFDSTGGQESLRTFHPTDSRSLLARMARNLANFTQSPEKIFYLNLAIELDPSDAQLRFQRAFEHINESRSDKARSDLEYLLKHKPQGVNLLRLQAYYDSIFGQP